MSKSFLVKALESVMHSWRVREAKEVELDPLYQLYQRISENDTFNEELSSEEFRKLFNEIQQDPSKEMYVLVDDEDTIAGMLELLYVNDQKLKDNPKLGEEKRHNTIIEFIGIDPDLQGQQLGHYLIQQALTYARSQQSLRIRVDVHRENQRALALYESTGFERIGEHKAIDMLKLAYDFQ